MSSLQKHLGWLLVVATWLVYTWPLWFDSGNLYLGDLAVLDVPTRVFAGRAIRAGWFPTWTDQLAGGLPLFSESQASIAYPFFLLFVLFPEPKTADWYIAIHYLVFGLGMYALARQQGARRISSAVGAMLLMTSWGLGYTHAAAPILTAWSWQPWSLWCLGKYSRGKRWALWPFTLTVAGALLAGPPMVALSTFPLCVLFWSFVCWKVGWRRWLGGAAICALIPAGLAAVQIAPLFGYFLESTRHGQQFEELAAGTAPSWRIFAPWGFGLKEPLNAEHPQQAAWQAHLIYGLTACALASAAWRFWRRRETWFWLGAVALFLLVAMESPFLELASSIPPFSWFRYASAYLWAAFTCAYVLAAQGLSRWEEWQRSRSLPSGVRYGTRCITAAVILLIALGSADFRRYLSDGPFYTEFDPVLSDNLGDWRRKYGQVRIFGPLPPIAAKDSMGGWRESTWRQRVAALAPDYNMIHDIASINHYMQFSGTVTNKRLFEVGQLLLERKLNAFRAAAVTHLSLDDPNPPPGYERLPAGSGYFYKSQEPRPPAWMVFQTEHVDDGQACCRRLADEQFDPYRTALVETPTPTLDAPPNETPSVEMIPDIRGRKEFQVQTAARGMLVMSYTYFTQMEATIDGLAAPVVPVNHAFCGVVVPPGDHRVVLRYNPWEIYLGLTVSLATLAVVVWRLTHHWHLARTSAGIAAG